MSNEEQADGDVVRGEQFSGGPARDFLSSLADDERLFEADLAIDRAHLVMLAEQDIIEPAAASKILDALNVIGAGAYELLPEGEDVHAAIETRVIEIAGEAGERLHTARSRNDEVAACLRYRLREDLLDATQATLAVRDALVSEAAEQETSLMPGYTHRQPAQPTTVAHWLLSYESAIRRDTARLFDAYDRTNQSPLGAAAFAGTPFPINRRLTADLLGFDGLIENSMDAVSARDFLFEAMGALSGLALTLSGLAADLSHFTNRGFVELDDDYASTSSIMPQKKNPDTMELVRATTGDAAAGLQGLLTTLKGLPRAYNRDLQAASPHVWSTVDAVTEATEVTAGAVETATWDEESCAAAAGEDFTTATGVADQLAMAGIPFRTAHEIVSEAAANGGDLTAVKAAAESVLDGTLADVVDPAVIESALDPAASVASRDSVGGPAAEAVETQLERAEAQLETGFQDLTDRRQALEQAEQDLWQEVTAYA
jgi:argininosuccinate lyase